MKKLIFLCFLSFTTASTQAQLTNLDFENWQTDTISQKVYPVNWMQLTNKYCYQEPNAQHGSYALQVSVWYYYAKTMAVQKAAFTTRPYSLEGYYTYSQNQVRALSSNSIILDTALVSVLLTKWNNTTMQADTVGFGLSWLYASASYNHFSCPVTYSSAAIPDSVTVIFDPSIVHRYENATTHQAITQDGKCSFLTIDNLSIQQFPTGIPQVANNSISIYPNPASGNIQVHMAAKGNYTVTILDILGREIKRTPLNGQINTIPVTNLAPGIYQLLVTGGDGQLLANSKIAIAR